MKIKNKRRILLSLGTMVGVITPIITVVSCGQKESPNKFIGLDTNDRLNLIKQSADSDYIFTSLEGNPLKITWKSHLYNSNLDKSDEEMDLVEDTSGINEYGYYEESHKYHDFYNNSYISPESELYKKINKWIKTNVEPLRKQWNKEFKEVFGYSPESRDWWIK